MKLQTARSTASGESPNVGVIEVRVQKLEELFNTFDPSPFPQKDLDDDAEEFIVSWAQELPRKSRLVIRVQVLGGAEGEMQLENTRDAIRAYFGHRVQMIRLRFKRLMSRARVSLLVGTLFLVACTLVANLIGARGLWGGQGAISDVLREGLIIAGWVAMWRPLDIILYDWWPVLGERRLYERLSESEVEIVGKGG